VAADIYYFECLKCGAETPIEASPPRCPRCASGTGIVRPVTQAPDQLGEPGAPAQGRRDPS